MQPSLVTYISVNGVKNNTRKYMSGYGCNLIACFTYQYCDSVQCKKRSAHPGVGKLLLLCRHVGRCGVSSRRWG